MTYRTEVLTLFPPMIRGYAAESIIGKAIERGLVELTITDIRDFADGKHRTTDDSPYGGGAGMVMKVEPLVAAIEQARARLPGAPVLLMSPRGPIFDQPRARELAGKGAMILVCGRYEGVDERALAYVDGELSLGDFVLTGGELPALCVMDAVARLVPGVLGNAESATTESFEQGLLEHPHYTRPAEFRGAAVPAALQSGDHARIERWRRWQALKLTEARRPDLYAKLALSKADLKLLKKTEDEL
ncbi:MAG: tRNA (guanine-N1)-methyltransferase [Myxococcaceae bacterium]|nr:tRNA (guanine-N1)-methyltransferase [Myxococcaceae bacterium]